jgi:hypothetical protein
MKKSILWILACITMCYSWGLIGHETVAYIAESHLTAKTKTVVYELLDLNEEEDLSSISYWADSLRNGPARKQTSAWHFIDLNVRTDSANTNAIQKRCKEKSCVVNQINDEITVLKNSKNSDTLSETLKFLVHFVGDVHCPVHCANDDDKGGNLKTVKLFNQKGTGQGSTMSLHAVWDRLIKHNKNENSAELASTLDSKITEENILAWENGTASDWAFESFSIAKNKIYKDFPNAGPTSKTVKLSKNYYKSMRPTAEEQLEKAGIRLAYILNSIYAVSDSLSNTGK